MRFRFHSVDCSGSLCPKRNHRDRKTPEGAVALWAGSAWTVSRRGARCSCRGVHEGLEGHQSFDSYRWRRTLCPSAWDQKRSSLSEIILSGRKDAADQSEARCFGTEGACTHTLCSHVNSILSFQPLLLWQTQVCSLFPLDTQPPGKCSRQVALTPYWRWTWPAIRLCLTLTLRQARG